MTAETEILALAPQAETLWQPVWQGEKGAWVCQREQRDDKGKVKAFEQWGATMRGPAGGRFSAAHFPDRGYCEAQCDLLNGDGVGG